LAHRLASLHNDRDEKVFDSVVVVTDRTVLDQQLQDTIYQFEHKQGVVAKIDAQTKATQLADALSHGKLARRLPDCRATSCRPHSGQAKDLRQRRGSQMVPAWQNWKVVAGDSDAVRLLSYWDRADRQDASYRLMAVVSPQPLRLTGKVAVRPLRTNCSWQSPVRRRPDPAGWRSAWRGSRWAGSRSRRATGRTLHPWSFRWGRITGGR